VSFSVASSDTSVATVSPNSVTWNNCGDTHLLTVTPVGEGTATVSLTQTANNTGRTFNAAPATFTVNVGPGSVGANQAPVVDTAAADANGTEGDTLSTSGAFSDPDGDSLTLTADNTEGTFTDNGDGTWSWSLATTDDVTGGTITVTATDPDGETAIDSFTYSAVNADPVLSALTFGGSNCDPTLSFSFSDAGSADTHTGSIDWGDGSTDDSFTSSPVGPVSHHYGSAGSYPITVDVADDDLGTDSDSTQSHTVNNIPSAILQPINNTGPRSAFKLGGTIPVKITATDCDGDSVGSLTPTVKLQKVDVYNDPDGTDIEPASTANPTSGTTMRYDATGQQYIYNLATKGLALANYMVFVNHPSFASPVTAIITLKK
jgi:hypothetical protein